MPTATKTNGKVTARAFPIGINGVRYEITDRQAKATAHIGRGGPGEWLCLITRYGRNWKFMAVTGTDNPESIYELAFQLGERHELNMYAEYQLPSSSGFYPLESK